MFSCLLGSGLPAPQFLLIHDILVAGGADVNAVNKDGTTPLHYLVRRSPSRKELLDIEKCLDLLIKAGVSIDSLNKHEETPLHNAVMHGNLRMVKALLRRNASLEQRYVVSRRPSHQS